MNRQQRKTKAGSLGLSLRIYRSLSPALCWLLPHAAQRSAKLAAGVQGREGLMDRLLAAGSHLTGCLWFHVSSVGEYEQAKPVIAELRRRGNASPIVVTHFSPSGYEYALKRPCADLHDYLPFDHPDDMDRLVEAWRPRLLTIVASDAWPNLVLAASRREVPIALLAGSLPPNSVRLSRWGRPLYRDLFNRFDHLGVCTADEKDRFVNELGVEVPVSVTGDTRVEQVILRFEDAAGGATSETLRSLGGRILVLGSTWPPDEDLWFPILPELLSRFPDLRIVLTPHEPLPERLAQLESALEAADIPSVRLSQLTDDRDLGLSARAILTDSIGVLAEIYRAGNLAYVGGSFTTGVHNTMEPAVAGLPVLFGPRIRNAEEAGELVRHGAGFIVELPNQALDRASELLGDSDRLREAGTHARQVVLDQRGATERSMAVLEELLKHS